MSTRSHSPTRPDDRGFTLVEVVIAIVLVGILSAVVVVGVGNLTTRGTTAACTTSADAARAAATTHLGTTGTYPTTFTQMTSATPPALTLPTGATIDSTGRVINVGSWNMVLVPGTGTQAPRFLCSTDAPTGFTLGPTGNFYRYVDTPVSHAEAVTAAATFTFAGRTGHLATITSAAEQSFALGLVGAANLAWLGGTDQTQQGVWRWTGGPEAGTQFSNGATPTGGAYTNWLGGEPNGGSSEDCVHIWGAQAGRWNDRVCTAPTAYLVEISLS